MQTVKSDNGDKHIFNVECCCYGYFRHSIWNSQTISLFGKGTVGMSGLILTFKYSVSFLLSFETCNCL